MYYDNPMMTGYGWGWDIISSLIWVGCFVFIAILGYKLLKGPAISRGTDPMSLAKQRYAKGEIDKAQFDQLKKDISDSD